MHHHHQKKIFFHRLTIYTQMPYLRFHCSIHTHTLTPPSPCSSMFFSGEKNSAYQPYNTQSKNQIKNYRTESKVFHERKRDTKQTTQQNRGPIFIYPKHTRTHRQMSKPRKNPNPKNKSNQFNSIHHHTFERKKKFHI